MAEAFFQTFEDFEQEWIELGKEFEAVFGSGNSPQDIDSSDDEDQLKSGIKRKLSETEDSIILTQRKENPAKCWALEKRFIQPALPVFKPTLAGTMFSPISPAFNIESPDTTESPRYSSALPDFKPTFAGTVFRPVPLAFNTESPETTESTWKSPALPEFKPMLRKLCSDPFPLHAP